MAAASDRAEVDTARPFRSVKEAVAVFGDRILIGNSHSRHSSSSASAAAIATASAAIANNATATATAKHEGSSSSSSTMSFSPTPMAAESETAEIMPATVPMSCSAPSSPASLASSSPAPVQQVKPCSGRGGSTGSDDDDHRVGNDGDSEAAGGGLVVVRSAVQKLEADVAATRQEVAQLRKRGNEVEMALASLSAQLHRGLSKLAEMEADSRSAGRRRSVGGDTDVASSSSFALRSDRWGGDRLAATSEYLPSFSHALSLGEVDDDAELMGSRSRRRKARKVKPIMPLIGDILFSKRKSTSTKEKGDDGLYSGDHYGVLG